MLATRSVNKPLAAQRASSRKAAVVVRSHADNGVAQTAAKVALAGALAATVAFGPAEAAKADIAGLTPCSESKAYAKRLKNEVKGLNKRLKQVGGRAAIGAGREGGAISLDCRRERNLRCCCCCECKALLNLGSPPPAQPAIPGQPASRERRCNIRYS